VPTRSAAHSRKRSRNAPPAAPATRKKSKHGRDADTERLLRHWRDAVPNDRMAHLVKDATRALVRALQMRLAEHDVSFGHWTFLRILWESDGLTQRELSREAGVMEPTTFAALKAMEARGYVVRRHLAGNRRKVHIFLTAQGRALKRRLVPLAQDVNRIAVRGVAAADIVATRRVLLAVLVNLARDELQSLGRILDLADKASRAGRAKVKAQRP
jgi:MarR family transcriptional regulator, organic hydroperoxide resistance regulator